MFPPLGTPGPMVPTGPAAMQDRGNGAPVPPGQMSLGQLHGARMSLMGRGTPEAMSALAQIERMIVEAEIQETKRRRRAAKIAEMAPYNNLMFNSEKDFITRIQLSQLLNTSGPGGDHDPLENDFYFTVYQSIKGARVAGAPTVAGKGKRHQAMAKMAIQVQKIVADARKKPRATQRAGRHNPRYIRAHPECFCSIIGRCFRQNCSANKVCPSTALAGHTVQ